ncbi:MAG: TetR/AcrR family transcriptional regulator [Bacteroidota bacterium]
MRFEVELQLNEKLFVKNPQATDFGRNLLKQSICLIDEIGFEKFTFRKVAQKLNTAEASVYRYFENKHHLLLYLTNWYWEWTHYMIDRKTLNLTDPKKKLEMAIHLIANSLQEEALTSYIDQKTLINIIIREGSKSYHIHDIDEENKDGLFLSYKELVEKVAGFINEYNPKFKYKKSLVSNVFEMANNQIYFAEHLPRLTDIKDNKDEFDELEKMIKYFVFTLIKK